MSEPTAQMPDVLKQGFLYPSVLPQYQLTETDFSRKISAGRRRQIEAARHNSISSVYIISSWFGAANIDCVADINRILTILKDTGGTINRKLKLIFTGLQGRIFHHAQEKVYYLWIGNYFQPHEEKEDVLRLFRIS